MKSFLLLTVASFCAQGSYAFPHFADVLKGAGSSGESDAAKMEALKRDAGAAERLLLEYQQHREERAKRVAEGVSEPERRSLNLPLGGGLRMFS